MKKSEKELFSLLEQYGYKNNYEANSFFAKKGYLKKASNSYKRFINELETVVVNQREVARKRNQPRYFEFDSIIPKENFEKRKIHINSGGNHNPYDNELAKVMTPFLFEIFRSVENKELNFTKTGWAYTFGLPVDLSIKQKVQLKNLMYKYCDPSDVDYCVSRHSTESGIRAARRVSSILKILKKNEYIKLDNFYKTINKSRQEVTLSPQDIEDAKTLRSKLIVKNNMNTFDYVYPKNRRHRTTVEKIKNIIYEVYGCYDFWNTLKVELIAKQDTTHMKNTKEYMLDLYDRYNLDLVHNRQTKYFEEIMQGQHKNRMYQATYEQWSKIYIHAVRFGLDNIELLFKQELRQIAYFSKYRKMEMGWGELVLPESNKTNTYPCALDDSPVTDDDIYSLINDAMDGFLPKYK